MVAHSFVYESFDADVDANSITDFLYAELFKYVLVTLNQIAPVNIVRYSACQHLTVTIRRGLSELPYL